MRPEDDPRKRQDHSPTTSARNTSGLATPSKTLRKDRLTGWERQLWSGARPDRRPPSTIARDRAPVEVRAGDEMRLKQKYRNAMRCYAVTAARATMAPKGHSHAAP